MQDALGMKHKLHGTTPIEHTQCPTRCLNAANGHKVSSGMSWANSVTGYSQQMYPSLSAEKCLLFSVKAFRVFCFIL